MSSTPTRAPRQADIARLVGVSQTTVSAVINGLSEQYGIAEETRQRVITTARDLGYAPNRTARRLRGKRSQLLGVHTFEPVFPVSASDFYHGFLVGIEEQAVDEAYDLVLFTSTEGSDRRRLIFRDGVNTLDIADGSILLGVEFGSDELARLTASGYPFVHIGRRKVEGHDLSYVGIDYQAGVSEVVQRLVALDHGVIAYLAEPVSIQPMLDRRSGYELGCRLTGIKPRAIDEIEVADLTVGWLRSARAGGVSAVVTESVGLAERLRTLAGQDGIAVPGDLSIVVLNDAPDPVQTRETWSAISIPRREAGRAAVRLLVAILGGEDVNNHVLLPCVPPGDATIAGAERVR